LKASLSQKHELHLHQKRSFEEEFAKKEATLHQTHTQKMQALALKERQLQEKTMLLQRQLKDLSTSQEQLRVLTQAASLNQKKQTASPTYSEPLQTRQVVPAQVPTRTSDARPLSQVPLPSFPPVMPSTSRTSPTTQQNKISQVIPTQSFNDIPSISSDMTSMPIEYGTDPANPHQASRASALDFLIELAYTAYDVDKARALETYNQIRSIYASLPPHEKKRVHTKILSLHKRLIA
jgi:hypothetical protein